MCPWIHLVVMGCLSYDTTLEEKSQAFFREAGQSGEVPELKQTICLKFT